MSSTLSKACEYLESHPESHFVLQFPSVTLKQIAVVGLKQLVVTILTGSGTPEVTFRLNLSNRLHLGIILTTQLKVRNEERLSAPPSIRPGSGLLREREAFKVMLMQQIV